MLWQGAQTFAQRLISGQVSSWNIEIPTRDQQRLVRTMRQLMDAIQGNIDAIAVRNTAQVVLCGGRVCGCVCAVPCACAPSVIVCVPWGRGCMCVCACARAMHTCAPCMYACMMDRDETGMR